MKKKKRHHEIGTCAYCGKSNIPITRDHIPPATLFSSPRPNNLIRVPACEKCHDSQTSRDDEYFKLIMSARIDTHEHPDARQGWKRELERLKNPFRQGLRNHFISRMRMIDLYTKSDLYIGKTGLMKDIDIARLCRVIDRITRGLFFIHYGKPLTQLPENYNVMSFPINSIDTLPLELKEKFKTGVLDLLKYIKDEVIGNNTFVYKYITAPDNKYYSVWFYMFYGKWSYMSMITHEMEIIDSPLAV